MSFAGEDLEVPLPPPLFTADEVECSKECCRGVLEEVDERDISKQAWEDVTVCLARASVALLSGASVHQMPDIDIDSVVPTRNGIWVKESLLRHPGGRILRGELQILVHFLSKSITGSTSFGSAGHCGKGGQDFVVIFVIDLGFGPVACVVLLHVD